MEDRRVFNIKKIRHYLLEQIKDVEVELLNQVPPGFNNNIAWNLGHLLAAQQGICYVRAGIKSQVGEDILAQFRPGTRPERLYNRAEIEEVKLLLDTTLDQFESDLNRGIFVNYPTWMTRYGVEIASIDDAARFLLYHEGLHAGTIMAMKRIVAR